MNRDRFVRLIVDFCAHCGISDAMGIVRGGPVEVEGVNFSLTYFEGIDPRLLLIYCDIAAVPKGEEAQTYSLILSKNFYLSAHGGPVFTLEPDSGRILMARAEDLEILTPPGLVQGLQKLSVVARSWREPPMFDERQGQASLQRLTGPGVPSAHTLHRQRNAR